MESEAQRGHSLSVQMAGARPGLGRAGMAPEMPWHGEVPLTKNHFLLRCSSAGSRALPHAPARARAGIGVDPVSLPCVGHQGQQQKLARGSVLPAPARATCATLQEALGSRAPWQYNGIIDGPLLLGLI